MITFNREIDENIYDMLTREVDLNFDGETSTITIHSLYSFRVQKEKAAYLIRQQHAEDNDLLIEDGEVSAGMGVTVKAKVPTQWNKEHNALLAKACVTNYPESRDLFADLVANTELTEFIIEQAIELQSEFLSKKKI